MIELARYPQLRLIAWQRDRNTRLDGREALALYESNGRFVDPRQLIPAETRQIRRLAKRNRPPGAECLSGSTVAHMGRRMR